ncbi:MAG: hypothetical protein KF689_07945 [Gemmatimonadaceae bacterium]|nr:hypothetical protein [Gemmatimonadaceae bacterium]MCW5827469.1 hypothetical protein [Gemmatimonadaceae bacterium]
MTTSETAVQARLEREARQLTRYLIDADCPPHLVQRYVQGHRVVVPPPLRVEAAVVSFGFGHPWSLPLLDAAAAWLPDGNGLRQKVLLMTAILEAGPEFAHEFLPRPASRLATLVHLAGIAAAAALRVFVGVPLTLIIRWRSR